MSPGDPTKAVLDYGNFSKSGIWNAIGGGLGLVGDIAGAFSKNAQASAANAFADAQHKSQLSLWAAKNAENSRINQYRIKSWALQNEQIIGGYNRRVQMYDIGKQTFAKNIKNIQQKLERDYFNENINIRRLYGDIDLNNFEELKASIAKQGTENNEQTGVSAHRNAMMKENEYLVPASLAEGRTKKQLAENYSAAMFDKQIAASNTQTQLWAQLGLPPQQPTLLPAPPFTGGPMTSPMRGPRAQGFGWGDALKIGLGTASTVAGLYGTPSNFMRKLPRKST